MSQRSHTKLSNAVGNLPKQSTDWLWYSACCLSGESDLFYSLHTDIQVLYRGSKRTHVIGTLECTRSVLKPLLHIILPSVSQCASPIFPASSSLHPAVVLELPVKGIMGND